MGWILVEQPRCWDEGRGTLTQYYIHSSPLANKTVLGTLSVLLGLYRYHKLS